MGLPRIVYIGIAGISLYIASQFINPSTSTSICDAANNLDRISCGQNIIFTADGSPPQSAKRDGFAAFKRKDYPKAIEYLKKDWETTRDPETSISLANATILRDRPTNVKTIAVVVPRSTNNSTPPRITADILKGAAAAQQEWNNENHQWKLLVAIANDINEPEAGKSIAAELVKHQDILAVLGHYSSDVTVPVKDIYQQAKTVLLSATATSDELTADDRDPNNYFFRVLGSTQVSARHLAQKWAISKDKIALFYTPNKKFSASFRKAFFTYVPKESVVQEFDLSNPHKAAQELAVAKAAGAKVIVIIPDAFTAPNERGRVLDIINANQGELPILGASPVRDAYLFKVTSQSLKNLIITIPLHPSDRHIDTARLNQAPNWWGVKSQLHERIINTYDGMQVLLAALDKSTDRQTVRQTIATPGFSVQGITGKISFHGSDRAQKIDSVVTPISCTEKDGCNFQLVN